MFQTPDSHSQSTCGSLLRIQGHSLEPTVPVSGVRSRIEDPSILTLYVLPLHDSLTYFVLSRWGFSAPPGHSRVPVFSYHNSSYTEMWTCLCGPKSTFLNLIYLAWVRALCLVQLILSVPGHGKSSQEKSGVERIVVIFNSRQISGEVATMGVLSEPTLKGCWSCHLHYWKWNIYSPYSMF